MTLAALTRRLLTAAMYLLVGAATMAQPAPTGAAGSVLATFPQRPDAKLRYVVYLHGRIVEEQGRRAVSPEFGAYQYDDIVAALAGHGVAVVGEVRPKGTDPKAAADHVGTEVRRLMDAGVPPANITVVGASKGALIAMLASTKLEDRDVGWVIMANCNDSVTRDFGLALHGRVLSIYESSDDVGGTCAPLFAKSPAIAQHAELRLETGLRHGFLYRPLPEWVKPAIAWSERRETE